MSESKTVLRKQVKRDQMAAFFAKLPGCLIGMEACGRRIIGLENSKVLDTPCA